MAKQVADADDAKSAKSKMPIYIAIAVVVAFAAAFLIAKQMLAKPAKVSEKPEVGAHIMLEEFLINLADPTNDRYLKTIVSLGLKKDVPEEKFKEKIPVCRDAIVMVLTSKKLADVRTLEGKLTLKDDIVKAVNKALGKNDVVEVDFQTFATQ